MTYAQRPQGREEWPQETLWAPPLRYWLLLLCHTTCVAKGQRKGALCRSPPAKGWGGEWMDRARFVDFFLSKETL